MTKRWISGLVSLFAVMASTEAFAFSTSSTNLGPIIGPARPYSGYYGTDLGFSSPWYVAGGSSYQILLFGDTYTNANGATPANNDAVGYFVTAPIGTSSVSLSFAGMAQVHDQVTGTLLDMGGGKTPVTSFYTAANTPYGVFNQGAHQACTSSSQCNGLFCDTSMGAGIGGLACWIPHSANGAACQHIQGNANMGLCIDQTSSMIGFADPSGAAGYVPVPAGPTFADPMDGNKMRSEAGKIYALATVQNIGAASTALNNYVTYPFITNKFLNVSTRASVSDTVFSRPTSTSTTATIWAWGKPNFFSNSLHGGRSELYLAKAVSPVITAPISFQYYTSSGTWSSSQANAAPLQTDVAWEDGAAGDMGITYLDNLVLPDGPNHTNKTGQWVMLYGGGVPPVWAAVFGGVVTDMPATAGAIKMRTAPYPWGPWSAPQTVLAPTDPVIFSTFCNFLTGASCNPSTLPIWQNTQGALYASQIVEAWDASTATTADLGWFVSLWNPYQVQEIKTHMTFP